MKEIEQCSKQPPPTDFWITLCTWVTRYSTETNFIFCIKIFEKKELNNSYSEEVDLNLI